MKMRLFLLMLIALMLFTQCKNEEEYVEERKHTDMVKVSVELPVDCTRSDFTGVLPEGKINWGNDNDVEYLYLALVDCYAYNDKTTSGMVYVGEMFEMEAKVDESTDKLHFVGMVPQNLIYSTKKCTLYYFGNNGKGEEGTNVTNIYDKKYPDCLIGKTVSFSNQNGSIENIGDFHVASIPVDYIHIVKNENKEVVEFKLSAGLLKSNMSVAMLDLTDETTLRGNATYLQSYTIKWVGRNFQEFIGLKCGATYDVSGNPGEKSFVALLPTDLEPPYLEFLELPAPDILPPGTELFDLLPIGDNASLVSDKGQFMFENGIERNHVYVGGLGHTIEESTPIKWQQP